MTDLSTLRTGGKPAIARVLARLESAPDDPEIVALLNAAYVAPTAQVIGLTGPPGVGKTMAGTVLARRLGAFHPPQSYRYLQPGRSDDRRLLRLIGLSARAA